MTNLALITGASSGIGKELARYHASLGGDLIITARREAALNALKTELEKEYAIRVDVIAMDLSGSDAAKQLHSKVTHAGHSIDILINNAGFGGHGTVLDRDVDADLSMIDLNVSALVTLTHLFGADMAAKGGGKILNVGSIAGFMPGPNQAAYFASKAFVNSFSQAVDQELRSKGVTSTVLAPGYVETEFAKSANLDATPMVQRGGRSAASVAKHGYDAMMRGELMTINERGLSFLFNWLVPFMPRRRQLKMVQQMQAAA